MITNRGIETVPGAREEVDDAVLVQLAHNDPTAFGTLYRRYRTRVYWYLRSRSPSDEDAADLTQQVFLAAFDRLHRYRPKKASFATWLFTIARNTAVDFHRQHHVTTNLDSLPPDHHPTDEADFAADAVRREAADQSAWERYSGEE